MTRNISVMGIYPDRATVSDARNVLNKAGFRATDISILWSDNQGSKDFAHQKHNKALQGAAIGSVTGAIVGAGLGWLIATQSGTVAAAAPVVAAGPILAAIAGAGAGGTLGWIIGWMTGLRLTEYVAKRFAGRVRNSGILLSVHCDSPEWCDRAKKTLKDTGAQDISATTESAAAYGTEYKPTERAPAVTSTHVQAIAPQPPEYVPVETHKTVAP